MAMDVELPNGTVITDVPDGMSKADLVAKLKANGYDTSWYSPAPVEPPKEPTKESPSIVERVFKSGIYDPLAYLSGGLKGIGEGVLAVGTGLGASAAGGLKGLGTLATGGSMEQAAKDIQETQQKYTYAPRTEAGQAAAWLAGAPIEYAAKGAGYLGGLTAESISGAKPGSPEAQQARLAGEFVGKTGTELGATIAGGGSALRGAKALGTSIQETNKAKLDALQQEKSQNALADKIMARSKALGFILPAEEGIRGSLAALGKTESRLKVKNEEKATQLAAQEVGLKELSPESIAARDIELNKPYENIIKAAENKIGEMTTPPETIAALQKALTEIKAKIEYDPVTFSPLKEAVPLLEQQLARTTHTPQMLMEQIKQLRRDSRTNAKKADDPNKLELASTQRLVANMLENVFEANLAETPALMRAFKEARTEKAKLRAVEEAYNDATGKISIQKLANLSDSLPLTGNLADIANFGKAFPTVSGRVTGAPSSPVTMMDLMFSGGSLAAGHPFLAAGQIGTRLAIPVLAESGRLQKRNPTYSLPLSNRAAGMLGAKDIFGRNEPSPNNMMTGGAP